MEENNIKYNPNRCLNVHELRAYSKNVLPQEEKEIIKKHINQCELCKDAIDGYSFFNENNVEYKVALINKRIRKRTEYLYFNKGKFFFNNNFHQWISLTSIAVSIIIVLGTLLYINYAWNRHSSLMANEYIENNKIQTAVIKEKRISIEKEKSNEKQIVDFEIAKENITKELYLHDDKEYIKEQVDENIDKKIFIKSLNPQTPSILETYKSYINPAVYKGGEVKFVRKLKRNYKPRKRENARRFCCGTNP